MSANRTPLEALLLERTLHRIGVSRNDALLDAVADQPEAGLKNVCAKVHPDLSRRIDEVCDLLDISKRRFLESAMVEALEQAYAIFEAEGLYAALEGKADGVTATWVPDDTTKEA